MPSPLNIKRPKEESLINQLLVCAVILSPFIFLFYLYRNGMSYHFDVPAINLLAHILFFLIPLIWVKIFYGTKLEFSATGETLLDKQSTLMKLKHCWWMMLIICSPLFLCAIILVKEFRFLLTQGIPDFSSSPGSLLWSLLLLFALGIFYREAFRSGYILTVSEGGVRPGLSSFCEWENIDHVVCHDNTFSIYHKACKYLPYSGFTLNTDNKALFNDFLKKYNIVTKERNHPSLFLVQLSVIAVTSLIIVISLYIYNQAGTDIRWLVVGTFMLSIVATMLLEKIRGISKVSKLKPQIEAQQRNTLADRNEEFPDATIPEITSEIEEDAFVDLVFGVSHFSVENRVQTMRVAGRSDSKDVGFLVELGADWESGGVGGLRVSSGTVRIVSTGNESDSFVHALAQIYGTEFMPGKMEQCVEFAAISLGGNPADLESGPVRMKLFFEPDGDDCAEVYANIDLAAKKFCFSEKDPEYRPLLVRALSSPQE